MLWWDLSNRQGGVIGLVQLRTSGLTDDQIDGLVRRHELEIVLPGVYRFAATPLTALGRQFAAMLWSGGVVSFGTASTAWSLGLADEPEVVDVSVLDRVSRNGHPDFVRVHRVLLHPDDVLDVNGLQITTRSRTTLDMVGVLGWSAARSLFERGFQQGWFTLADLDRRLDREKGRAGNVKLRAFREEITPGAQFEFERRFHKLLRAHGITGWVPQFVIRTATDGLVTVDIAFPDQKLIIELDGWSTHGGHERFGRDRKRDRRTLVTGWRTVRYVWGDLDDPAAVIAEIVCLLAA